MSAYRDLALSRDQIRLLTVSPAVSQGHDDRVSCQLEIIHLNAVSAKPAYHALSYTWGPPAEYGEFGNMTLDRNRSIVCNGQELLITANLEAFLQRLQRHETLITKKFWIDAICVDQTDTNERASQIRLMADIFSSAQSVISWIGEEDAYTGRAFELLKTLSEPSALLRRVSSSEMKKKGHAALSDDESMVAVARLFQRTYFKRAWIIQEVILAQNVTLLCGSREINWDTLVDASHFFSTTSWRNNPLLLGLDSNENSENTQRVPALHVPTTMQATKRSLAREHWADALLYALIRSRDFHATDPRDKVYSLLGLVQAHIADIPGLIPSYTDTQSIESTYTSAAIEILRNSNNLLLLTCAEGPLFQMPSIGNTLPSWVPDWRCEKPLGLRATGYKRYSASGLLTQRPIIDATALTIELKGIKVDDVDMIGEANHEVQSGKPLLKWLEILDAMPDYYPDLEGVSGRTHKIDALWRTLTVNTDGDPPRLIGDDSSMNLSFLDWLAERISQPVQLTSSESQKWGYLAPKIIELLAEYGSRLPKRPVDNDEHHNDDFATSSSHAKYLRLFKTRQGYLGYGSESLKVGDSVWIVPGSRVPLIIRPDKNEGDKMYFRLVGGTYLHGFMSGESVCPCCSKKDIEKIQSSMETFILR